MRCDVERLKRAIARILRHVDAAMELLEEVTVELERPSPARRTSATVLRVVSSPATDWLLQDAAAGAASLELAPTDGGAVMVSIGGRRPFRLQRKLGMLLRVLAAGPRDERDGLVVWKRRDEVIAALARDTGRRIGANRLNQAVHKLRAAFTREGANRWLVQTKGRGDDLVLRFALRAESPASAGDPCA